MKSSTTKFKHLIYSIGILTTFTLIAQFAFAEEEANTDKTPAERRAEIQAEFQAKQDATLEKREGAVEARQEKQREFEENREERGEKIQEAREERRALLSDRIQDRITNLAGNMKKRMLSAIERLTQVTNRIETRIEKLDALEVDTSESKRLLVEVRDKLLTATNNLEDIEITIEAAVTSENPRDAFGAVKATFMATRDLLKEAHQLIKESVATLKVAVAESELKRGVSDAVTDHTEDEHEHDSAEEADETHHDDDEESHEVAE